LAFRHPWVKIIFLSHYLFISISRAKISSVCRPLERERRWRKMKRDSSQLFTLKRTRAIETTENTLFQIFSFTVSSIPTTTKLHGNVSANKFLLTRRWGINFANILRATFSYNSFFCAALMLLTVCICNILSKGNWLKSC